MYRCTVERVDWLTPHIMSLTLRYAFGERNILAFHPGQYAAISFHRHGRTSGTRCFSIASSPHDQSLVQFGIRVGGKFTTALSKAAPGDTVYVRGPFGGFVFDPDVHQEAVFAAGGIGITPFMSMLRYLHATQYPHTIHLLYGVQSQDDIPFKDELRQIAADMPNLHLTLAISHGDVAGLKGFQVVQGRVDGALLHEALEGRPTEKSVFICGPPPFMNSLTEAAQIRGVPRGSIITEAFKQGPNRQTGKVISWPRNMYVLGGLGVAVGAFVITVTDIVKNLPSGLTSTPAARQQLSASNQRSQDLDSLVNSFPAEDQTTKAESPAVLQARAVAGVAPTSATPTATATTPKPTSSSGSTTKTTTTTTTPTTTTTTTTPTPTPTPPPPVCTTTQSGVTTCV